jgi:pimeloyl-ACP methyl ester carboxylesterase
MEPGSRHVTVRDLECHVLEWAPPEGAPRSDLSVLLVHGFADAAGSWDEVAPLLAAAGHHVVAPDLRGFGQTAWSGPGGYYHFPDYIADLDALVALLLPGRLAVVGHSMGGTASTLFAGARPERVARLALLEGLGPPDNDARFTPDRMTRWLDDVRGGGRPAQKAMTLDDALRRLSLQHPGVAREALERRLRYLATHAEDGRLLWRFDPLHRTTSPTPFNAATFRSFAARVACPVLLISGGAEGFHPPDEAERAAAFRSAESRDLAGAGHMMHWTRPLDVASALVEFFR